MSRILELYSDFIGGIFYSASSSAPAGFLACNGQTVSRTTYAALFAKIGTTWGSGDGSTTFGLPDLRGRVPVASGQGSGLTNRALAATGGGETHALSEGEMPAHNHSSGVASNDSAVAPFGSTTTGIPGSATKIHAVQAATPVNMALTGSKGSGTAHNNMQPFAVLHAFIKF